ncbi:hypothetical protein CCS77_1275 [Campylobacter concisus]|uniref:Uncharacterized protein n=1 Tax=Campylobacter concisus TaxID=199 RepID=A0A2R4P0X4_9BACT|nr:hypothetical protein CCS77_1275 [Campylobacter concisus]
MSLNLLCFGVFAKAEQILNFINLGNGLADILYLILWSSSL